MPRTPRCVSGWVDHEPEPTASRGVKGCVAWLHVELFYWGTRAAHASLSEGLRRLASTASLTARHAGEKPTAAATTTPTARPVSSAEST